VFINLGHGHNGFLTAALIGAALVNLDRRPWLAGLLLGLMVYKPQFGILFPLVLAATGRWRSFAAAAATVAALALITTLVFGVSVWDAFLASTHFTRTVVLEALKAAALIIAAILATPYSLDHDMTALAPAIAFLAVNGLRHGFTPFEKSALAILWIAPLVARSIAEAVLVPVGVLAMAAMLGVILHRAAQETRLFERRHPSQNPAS
jgi:alpha-1,2-mannosyltransferase